MVGSSDRAWEVQLVTVEESWRFEGASNPDDEAMLLGVRTPDETRGTLTLPCGPDVSGTQADAIRAFMIADR